MSDLQKQLYVDFNVALAKGAGRWVYPGGEVGVRIQRTAAPLYGVFRMRSAEDIVAFVMAQAALPFPVETLVMPYFPYARQDRVATSGDPCAVKVMAKLLVGSGVKKVITVDLHSHAGWQHCQEVGLLVVNESPLPFIRKYIDAAKISLDNLWLVSPDKGAHDKTVEYAEGLSARGVVVCNKERDPVTGRLRNFRVLDVQCMRGGPKITTDDTLLVTDDICDGGGSFLGVSRALEEHFTKTCTNVHLWTTHGIYSQGYDKLLERYVSLGCTDSFHIPTAATPASVHTIAI